MKYKMIVCDVDGTLLDSDHRISEENKKAIANFKKAGGLFSLATGRIEKSAVKLQKELSIDLPLILYNGAKIIDLEKNSVVYEKYLTYDQAYSAVRALKAFPVSAIFYSAGEGYTISYTESIKKHAEMEGITPVLAEDMMKIDLTHVNKILFAGNNDDGDDLLFSSFINEYSSICRALPFIVRSNPRYLEFLPEGCNKGSALEVLAEYLGLELKDIMCFGDNLNDMEMIQKAGLGVAMDNGHDDLKKAAGLIAPGNSISGVAAIIKMMQNLN